jgi:hypothetical protein
MKICSKCKQEKELTEFNKHRYGVTSWCKECVRGRSKQHYEENSISLKEKKRLYIQQRREWFNEFKKTLKCIKCGEDHIACLDFHHRDPKQKEFSIAGAVSHSNKEKVIKELEKCDVLCANCHRKHHYEE